MSKQIVDAELEQKKRRLRARMGRLRRRIDGRMRSSRTEARRLLSWKTYIRGYPGQAVMVAMGIGLALSAGLSARSLSRWFGLRIARQGLRKASRLFWQELGDIWAESKTASPAEQGGDDE